MPSTNSAWSELRRSAALKEGLEHRQGPFGLGIEQASDREEFQLFVGLLLRLRRLPDELPDFHLERLGVAGPPTIRRFLEQPVERGQRLASLAEAVLGVGLPVRCAVGLLATRLDHAVERVHGRLPFAGIERRHAAIVVHPLRGLAGRGHLPVHRVLPGLQQRFLRFGNLLADLVRPAQRGERHHLARLRFRLSRDLRDRCASIWPETPARTCMRA
jgi:hypothetical protein